jgi:anhydro-N-acetylmuramic acid kinase
VRFGETADGRLAHELLAFVQRPYDEPQRDQLRRVMTGATPSEHTRLDFALGAWLADAAIAAMAESGVARADVAAIASHGHTIWHEPPHATWQAGHPAVIAERTGRPVIADFRARDVAAGGQGAPLVPLADALLFAGQDHWRALQNLGGIGNVTVLPPGGDLTSVRAFDTGPGVAIIDGVVRALVPGATYDHDGALARAGTPISAVVDAALTAPFFAAEPPKSTGRELFTPAYIARFIADCQAAKPLATTADIVATATDFTARSIALAFQRFVPEPVAEVVLSGGGARNPALFDAIERSLAAVPVAPTSDKRRIVAFDDLFYDGESKEAVAFALLGWCHLHGRPGNVPGATGARGPRILGSFTPA